LINKSFFFASELKAKENFHWLSDIPQLEWYWEHKTYLLLLGLKISILFHLNTDSEFTKIASATSPKKSDNLNTK
jgi:hypothetical protein